MENQETGTRRAHMAGRIAAIAAPVLLAVALVVACIWGAEQSARAESLERGIQSVYRQAFLELNDNVHDMQVSLKKLMVVSSPKQYVLLLDDVWRLSGAAAANLAALPVSHTEVEQFNRFVVQAGDYARTLSTQILSGAVLGQEDRDQLAAVYEASVQTAAELERRLQEEDFPLTALTVDGYYGDGTGATAGSDSTSGEDEGAAGGEGAAGSEDEASIANYPTLIYDGPFSESTEKAEPRGLPEEEVDADAALQAAAEYVGGSLQLAGEADGTIPTYEIIGTDADGRSVELAITRQGGRVLWMMAEAQGGAEGVPEEAESARMRDAAKAYLDARGYDGMEATYAQFYAGIAVYNFASVQGGVILYPDLVKVYVERQSGKVIGVDAYNYLFSHTERQLPVPVVTEEEARESVNEALEIVSVRLALIPRTAVTEVLCYEFKGTYGGASFIVYINAVTGSEEQIFEIVNSDEGQLVV